MKYISITTLCILFIGCAKTEFKYAIVCDLPYSQADHSWLVVSNDEGDILQSYALAPYQSQIITEFKLKAKTGDDSYNLHLIDAYEGGWSQVYSYYGVRNGAAVAFQPESIYYPSVGFSQYAYLTINNLPGRDSVYIPGTLSESFAVHFTYYYDEVSHTMGRGLVAKKHQNVLVRIRSTSPGPFRSLYVVNTPVPGAVVDSVSINWDNSMPETDWRPLDLPNNNYVYKISIDAVDPGFEHFVTLAEKNSGIISQFNFPAGLEANSLLRIKIEDGYYTREKIFHPGEPIKIEDNDIRLTSATISGQDRLAVESEGAIDMLDVRLYVPDNNGVWVVQGEPATLKNAILPDLSQFVPGWFSPVEMPPSITVAAYQYDQLDYAQLVEGFPYKKNNDRVFPEARYGLKKFFKNF